MNRNNDNNKESLGDSSLDNYSENSGVNSRRSSSKTPGRAQKSSSEVNSQEKIDRLKAASRKKRSQQQRRRSQANSVEEQPKTILHLIVDLFLTIGRLFSILIKKGEAVGENFKDTPDSSVKSGSKKTNLKAKQSSDMPSRMDKRHLVTASTILGLGLIVGWLLVAMAPEAVKQPIKQRVPLIEVVEVNMVSKRIPIFSRGTVEPRTQLNLIAEVEGNVVYKSENLESGKAFNKGELLLSIDPARYELEVTKKQSAVASAELHLEKTKATAKVARKGAKRNASNYALHIPQLNEAKAKLAAAKADLDVAKLHLANTQIKAPFTGRVKTSNIDIGQFLNGGAHIADIYALDVAEIRLPISNKQIKLIDLPWFYSDSYELDEEPLVDDIAKTESEESTTEMIQIHVDEKESQVAQTSKDLPFLKVVGSFGGKEYSWNGQIKNAEGGLDENQLMYLVGQIEKPYRWDIAHPDRPPLEPGLFVEAEIEGKFYDAIFEVPRQALHGHNKVWLVDDQNQLQVSEVNVIYRGPDYAYIDKGLADGERLVITALDYVVNGMEVRVSEASPPEELAENPEPAYTQK